jgi:hypothetical protein
MKTAKIKKEWYTGEETKFISPDGEIITISNINEFAKSVTSTDNDRKNLGCGLGKLRSKTKKVYRGWKLYEITES